MPGMENNNTETVGNGGGEILAIPKPIFLIGNKKGSLYEAVNGKRDFTIGKLIF